jgi:hypothetical protein
MLRRRALAAMPSGVLSWPNKSASVLGVEQSHAVPKPGSRQASHVNVGLLDLPELWGT